jgi:nucleoside-diphosphate-sugar epimerase
MPRTAFVLGGTGFVGSAIVERLVRGGWEVTTASRGDPPPELNARHARLDRNEPGMLGAALGDGVDMLVDVIPFTSTDARQLLEVQTAAGSFLAISSAAVYADDAGRTFEGDEVPELPVPVPETQRTVEASDDSYAGGKIAVETTLLDQASVPVTVLRPAAIYGPRARDAREWHFVKRALDRRPAVLLAWNGTSRFHTSSVRNLAELVALAAERPASRVLNAADAVAPTVREISRAIAAVLGHEREEVLVSDGAIGRTPWSSPRPVVLDMGAARTELGYADAFAYEPALTEACDWLVAATSGRDWREVLDKFAAYYPTAFDYEAEDEFLSVSGALTG